MHAAAPTALNCPGPHNTAVALVEPAGHAYPAVHSPEQAAEVSPGVAPYTPPGHSPEHDALYSPGLAPYDPTEQLLQLTPVLYVPTGHEDELALMLPAGHTNPTVHWPEQFAFVSPVAAPYKPVGQSVHAPAPPVLYRPSGHTWAVAVELPSGQA